jgi:hypothetical protein
MRAKSADPDVTAMSGRQHLERHHDVGRHETSRLGGVLVAGTSGGRRRARAGSDAVMSAADLADREAPR